MPMKPLDLICEDCRADPGEPCRHLIGLTPRTGFHAARERRAQIAASPDEALDQRLSRVQQALRDGDTDHEAMSRTIVDARNRIREGLRSPVDNFKSLYDDSLITINLLRAAVDTLERAIRAHRDARGDDRCWEDDVVLYQLLPEGYEPPAHDTTVELHNCLRYIACRRHPATTYVSPEREIEVLTTQLSTALDALKEIDREKRALDAALREHDDAVRGVTD